MTLMRATGPRAAPLDVAGAATLALKVRADDQAKFLLASVPPPAPPVQDPARHDLTTYNRTVAGIDGVWSCISIAETGGDPAMGPTYWTEYGVVIDVIQDYGTPAEQAAIFGGTADAATRLAPVARFAAENGFGGWGELTKQKCGL